jgi:[ribosomal protein S5]-alanine N-acetyltransferase
MNFNTITTERLFLREMNPGVYRHVFTTYTDAQLADFFGFNTAEELETKKLQFKDGFTTFNRSFLYFQLLDKQTRRVIGWCGYHTWYIQHFRAEIGYVLAKETERRKGYMKEALGEIIRYGFENMNLNRIEAFIGAENTASSRLLQRYGFQPEGTLREHYYTNGRIEDSLLFSLLKGEYSK